MRNPKHKKSTTDFESFMSSDRFFELKSLPDRPVPAMQPVYGGARLATKADLEPFLSAPDEDKPFQFSQVSLLTADPSSGRYAPLYQKSLYFPECIRRTNLLVTSKIGGGKTSRFLLPGAFEDVSNIRSSLFWVDTKGDIEPMLSQQMKIWRPGQKPVVINFADALRTTHAINLVGAKPLLHELFEDVSTFCDAAEEGSSRQDSPFWRQSAGRWLVAILEIHLAEFGKASLADAHFLLEGDTKILLGLLDRHKNNIRHAADIASFIRSGSQNADTVKATLLGYLRHFVNENLCITTSMNEFDFETLFIKPTVLILELNQSDVNRYRPFLNMFVASLFRKITKYAQNMPKGRLPRPLNIYMDDLPALGRIPDLESYLNTLRSRDVRITAAIQTLGQLYHWYGQWGGDEVVAGFGTKIFQPHLEQFDAEWVARHAGTMTALDVEVTGDSNSSMLEQHSRSVKRELLTPEEVRLSPEHWSYGCRSATVFLPDMPPFQAWFRPGYELPEYSAAMNCECPKSRKLRRRKSLRYFPPVVYVPEATVETPKPKK